MNAFISAVGQWFASIPAVVWSGVIGATIAAGISYVGVRSANKGSLQRLREQHDYDREQAEKQRQHDARQKEEDRKAAIRREVYVKAVEEAHAVLAYIGGLPDRPLPPKDEDAALQVFLKASAKVWLVADTEGSTLSREMTNLVSELYSATLIAAHPIREGMEHVRQLDERIGFMRSEVKRVEGLIVSSPERKLSSGELKTLTDMHELNNTLVGELTQRRHKAFVALIPARREIFQTTAGQMLAVQKVLVRLVCALRCELHLKPNEEEFMRILEDMQARAMAVLDKAMGIQTDSESLDGAAAHSHNPPVQTV